MKGVTFAKIILQTEALLKAIFLESISSHGEKNLNYLYYDNNGFYSVELHAKYNTL
jgi:hypothetical protein